MKLHNLGNRPEIGYTTWGCMWDEGTCTEETHYRLKNESGDEIPMQTRTTAYWPDGSVKWTAHTADAAKMGKEVVVLPGEETGGNSPVPEAIEIVEQDGGFIISAGRMNVVIPADHTHLFQKVVFDGKIRLTDGKPVLTLEEPAVVENQPARVCRS